MGMKITGSKFPNEDDVLLITSSKGEAVCICRNYENDRQVEMVSSWRALTDPLPSRRLSGLVS